MPWPAYSELCAVFMEAFSEFLSSNVIAIYEGQVGVPVQSCRTVIKLQLLHSRRNPMTLMAC